MIRASHVPLLAATLVAAAFLSGCRPPAAPGDITGVLTLDGAPVAGAEIHLWRSESGVLHDAKLGTQSDGAGRYSISGVIPGKYRVAVVKWIDRNAQHAVTPLSYENPSTSALDIDVTSGSQTRDLAMQKSAAPPTQPPVPAGPAPTSKLPCSALSLSWAHDANYRLTIKNDSGADLMDVDLSVPYESVAVSGPLKGLASGPPKKNIIKMAVWKSGSLNILNFAFDEQPRGVRLIGTVRTEGGGAQAVDCSAPDPH